MLRVTLRVTSLPHYSLSPEGVTFGVTFRRETMTTQTKTVKLTPKQIRDLEKIAELLGVTPHALMVRFIRHGIRASFGTIDEELEIEKRHLDLERRQAEFLSKTLKEVRAKKSQALPPIQRIIGLFNQGDGEEARRFFSSQPSHVQLNIVQKLKKSTPEYVERLQEVKHGISPEVS